MVMIMMMMIVRTKYKLVFCLLVFILTSMCMIMMIVMVMMMRGEQCTQAACRCRNLVLCSFWQIWKPVPTEVSTGVQKGSRIK